MVTMVTMVMMMVMMMTTSSGSFMLGLLPSRLVIAVMIVLCFLSAFDAALRTISMIQLWDENWSKKCRLRFWDQLDAAALSKQHWGGQYEASLRRKAVQRNWLRFWTNQMGDPHNNQQNLKKSWLGPRWMILTLYLWNSPRGGVHVSLIVALPFYHHHND